MENASRALVIAGSILIAVIVIGILVYTYTEIGKAPQAEEKERSKEQIQKFNAEYESYQRNNIYGSEILTIMNKAEDNNINNISENSKLCITVTVDFVKPINGYTKVENTPFTSKDTTYKKLYKTFTDKTGKNDQEKSDMDSEFKKFKGRRFECTGIYYSSDTGKVNKITFKELKMKE